MVLVSGRPPGKGVVDAVASALRNFGSLNLNGGALAQVNDVMESARRTKLPCSTGMCDIGQSSRSHMSPDLR